jgi:acyl-CoA synthetase (NDP forming)/GNAT superfamily N-acetyltransferase
MNGMAQATGQVYALLADGSTVEIRPAGPADFDAVRTMHEAMSPDNLYLRFFSLSKHAPEIEARRICRDPRPGHMALLALAGGEVAGCASYDAGSGAGPGAAEVAFAVADHMHHRGIATLLLEHLVSSARGEQITMFTAETLPENKAMLKVFADAGLPVQRHYADGVMELTFPIPGDDGSTALDTYLNAVAERERRAGAVSLRRVLAPESVAVIGASRKRGTVGRAILDNIRAGGYAGRLYAVNARARQIGGQRCLPSVGDLPEPADLAVIAVPPAAVLDVAEQCGQRGVRSLVVVTAGLDATASADLLAVCRGHGMRLVGPNCFGVAVPGLGLDATFAARRPRPGAAGLVMQSGGLGFAMVDQLSRLGIGISSFASVGDKLDVSSNDMLMWWERDGITRIAVLYIESFGNPRKFARTARRVGASMPVLAVQAGRAGRAADALFEQAGIIVVPGFGDLVAATAMLASQPVPAGRTVAIVSNVGGAGGLAADACAAHGLTVHGAPVDTTATVSGAGFRQRLELLAADGEVDAIIAIVLPTGATGDLLAAIQQADVRVPLAAVVLNQAEAVRMIPRIGAEGQLPAYGYPEAAAAALARAARYGAWRAEPRGQVPTFPDVRTEDAHALVREFFRATLGGGWMPPELAARLLACYGIPLAEFTPAFSEDEAVSAFAAAAGPVVLKADVPGLMHKTDSGAVELDLRTEADVRAAYRALADRFGERQRQVLVQPMIARGTEVTVRVADDHLFGPLVVFGLGEVSLADHAARLTPLTDTDADKLIGEIRAGVDAGALRELLLRVSRLADDLPEITELDLSPVIVRADGAAVVDARIRAAPEAPRDPYLRKLR